MHIKIRIILAREINKDSFEKIVHARDEIVNELKATYDSVEIVFVF